MPFRSLRRLATPFALTAVVGSLALASVASVTPALAQSPAAGPSVTVVATEYAFSGLPASIPAGTTLTLDNQGQEVHELVVARRADGVSLSWQDLLTLPEDQVQDKVSVLPPLVAAPGTIAAGTIVVTQPGDYLAVDFAPQGMTALPDASATLPPGLDTAVTHASLGMQQAFTVTAPGTSPGPDASPVASSAPQPSAAPEASAAPDASSAPSASEAPAASGEPAAARTIELTASAALQFTDADGAPIKELAVTPGETLTINVTNSAGFPHNFYIGTDAQLQAGQNDQMTGIPDFNEGTQELTWTVPDDVSTLRFGCTVPGHYQLMNGGFTTGG